MLLPDETRPIRSAALRRSAEDFNLQVQVRGVLRMASAALRRSAEDFNTMLDPLVMRPTR